MTYAIIGFGNIGKAMAKAFARKGIEVSVATTRNPESFAPDAAAIGPKVIAKTLAEAVKADIIFLAVRFEAHPDVAKALPGFANELWPSSASQFWPTSIINLKVIPVRSGDPAWTGLPKWNCSSSSVGSMSLGSVPSLVLRQSSGFIGGRFARRWLQRCPWCIAIQPV